MPKKNQQETPKTETALVKHVTMLQEQVQSFTVTAAQDCEIGEELRQRIKKARSFITDLWGEDKSNAYKTYKTISDKINRYDKPLKLLYDSLGRKIGDWVREQERIEARKREQKRLEAERQAILEEQERRAQKAQNLIDSGKEEEAEELMEAEIDVEPVKIQSIPSSIPQIDRRTIREAPFKANVVNLKKLVEAVAKGEVPLAALEPNYKFLNNQAKFAKDTDALNYPGVEVVRG